MHTKARQLGEQILGESFPVGTLGMFRSLRTELILTPHQLETLRECIVGQRNELIPDAGQLPYQGLYCRHQRSWIPRSARIRSMRDIFSSMRAALDLGDV